MNGNKYRYKAVGKPSKNWTTLKTHSPPFHKLLSISLIKS